tara:strand:+ start:186198 stop:187988 length:1791 start_codon:yes stop_codon:yes gene_type:complete
MTDAFAHCCKATGVLRQDVLHPAFCRFRYWRVEVKQAINLLAFTVVPLCLASCSHEPSPDETSHEQHSVSSDTHAVAQSNDTSHTTHSSHDGHGQNQHAHGEHGNNQHSVSDHGHASHGHADTSHGEHDAAHSRNSAQGDKAAHRHHGVDEGHSKHGHTAHAKDKDGHDSHGHGQGDAQRKDDKPRSTTDVGNAETERLAAELADADAATIFSSRILPILKSDSASSCTECHFVGVELRDFILEDQAKTFASLKSTGMIDVDQPDKSKILRFISRKQEKSDPLIEKVRSTELVAFRAWIRAAVHEPELLKATSDVEVGTSLPPAVIRHARRDRVLSSFIDNIWSEMGRCINCHDPERNRQKIGRNGLTKEDVDAISWIVPRDPAGTLLELVDSGNIDVDDPAASLVLTKPAGLDDHGGGPKFFPGSPTYRNFLAFLTDYVDIKNGEYATPSDLPEAQEEISLLSEQQLRVTDIPAAFSDLPLQVDIYRRIPRTGKWSEHRWATGFSRVNGKRHVWQNPILVTAPADSPLAKEFRERKLLPSGEYRIRILIDRERKTVKDPTYELAEAEFVAEVQISGTWKPGYQPPKEVRFPPARD